MKTHREIVLEGQRIDESARRLADEQRRDATLRDAFAVVFSFPESRFTNRVSEAGIDAVHTHRRLRRIEAALSGDDIEYRLLQDEIETTSTGAVVKETGLVLMVASESAEEVLAAGYELSEQERLSDLLSPYLERAEAGEFIDAIEPHVIEEIEAVLGADDLLPASRLHAKAEIVKLLEGQIEPDVFIAAEVARRRYCEEVREQISEQPRERILIGQP